jgi:hypothetical protein
MHKSATKCNETQGKWCKNKHGASKIIDTFETYHPSRQTIKIKRQRKRKKRGERNPGRIGRSAGPTAPAHPHPGQCLTWTGDAPAAWAGLGPQRQAARSPGASDTSARSLARPACVMRYRGGDLARPPRSCLLAGPRRPLDPRRTRAPGRTQRQ